MYKCFLFVVFSLSYCAVVNGNITICIPIEDKENNGEVENYTLLIKTLKQQLTVLLEDNASKFYDHLEFDFKHPALSAKGEVNNVTVQNLNKYEIKFFDKIKILQNEIEIFNLTFTNISTVGEYNLKGNIGDLFDIWGNGNFWANALNFSISAKSKLPSINSTTACIFPDIQLNLQKMESWFSNLMDDAELEELMNHSISGIASEVIEVIWGEIKDAVDDPLQEWIDSIFNQNSSSLIKHVLKKSYNKSLSLSSIQ